MPSSGILHHVALVRTDISEEYSASSIRMTRIGELGMLAVTSNDACTNQKAHYAVFSTLPPLHPSSVHVLLSTLFSNTPSLRCSRSESVCRLLVTANVVPSSPILVTLMMEALRSSKTSILTRVTWHNIPEDNILHSHHHENLESYHNFFVCSAMHYCNGTCIQQR
jgi:hypothetical protein